MKFFLNKKENENFLIKNQEQPIKRLTQEENENYSKIENIENIEKVKLQNNTSKGLSWVFEILSHLSTWLLQQHQQPINNNNSNNQVSDDLWKDWEWVLSKTEEISLKQSEEEAQKIQNELKKLRKTAQTLKFRPYFLTNASKIIFENLSNEDKVLLQTSLDASKSSKIISDLIHSMEDTWLSSIQTKFFPDISSGKWKHFQDSYREKPYEKGVVGSLKELVI